MNLNLLPSIFLDPESEYFSSVKHASHKWAFGFLDQNMELIFPPRKLFFPARTVYGDLLLTVHHIFHPPFFDGRFPPPPIPREEKDVTAVFFFLVKKWNSPDFFPFVRPNALFPLGLPIPSPPSGMMIPPTIS